MHTDRQSKHVGGERLTTTHLSSLLAASGVAGFVVLLQLGAGHQGIDRVNQWSHRCVETS